MTIEKKDCQSCTSSLEEFMIQLIGHEIRNPLTVIGGLANRIYEKIVKDKVILMSDKEIVKLKAIKKEADRVFGVMSIFDSFVKNPIFNKEETDIHIIIKKILMISSDDRIEFKEDFSLLRQVPIDVARMSFSLLNIINNAKDAVIEKRLTDKNHKGEIYVKTGEQEFENLNSKYFFITIENNGVQIPDELIDRISQPSFTTKDNGTGFGLAFAEKMTRQHQGHLKIESTKGKTSFTIFIPF